MLGAGLWVAMAAVPWATTQDPAVPEVRGLHDVITVPADDACLASGLAEPVAAWLGRQAVEGDLRVEVTTDTNTMGFVLRRAGEVRVERSLSPVPAECSDRRAALGLAIAMALDAAVLEALVPPPPEPSDEPVRPPPDDTMLPDPDPASDDVEPDVPDPLAPAFRLAAVAEAHATLGVLPRAAFGAELGVEGGGLPWLDLRVTGGFVAGLPTALSEGQISTQLGWAALGLCPARAFGRVRVRLCAGVAAGALLANGSGFAQSQRVRLAWVAVRTGADLDVWLSSRVALRVGGRLLTPVVRGRLAVRDPTDELVASAEPAAAGGHAALGVLVRLASAPWVR